MAKLEERGTVPRADGRTGEAQPGEASGLGQEARERAGRVADEQRGWFAAELGRTAGALHEASQALRSEEQAFLGRALDSAATGLDEASRRLRDEDLAGLARRAEEYARRHPLAFLGGAAACGFFAARFFEAGVARTSRSSRADEPEEASTGRSAGVVTPTSRPAEGTPPVFGPHGEVIGGSTPTPPTTQKLYVPGREEVSE